MLQVLRSGALNNYTIIACEGNYYCPIIACEGTNSVQDCHRDARYA